MLLLHPSKSPISAHVLHQSAVSMYYAYSVSLSLHLSAFVCLSVYLAGCLPGCVCVVNVQIDLPSMDHALLTNTPVCM